MDIIYTIFLNDVLFIIMRIIIYTYKRRTRVSRVGTIIVAFKYYIEPIYNYNATFDVMRTFIVLVIKSFGQRYKIILDIKR